ncbi:Rhodanese-related sulfurtransferase [Salegentibacter echinorum]|uniref:Rhodanese-related sulfurtransferase n=1 Tax=Salegentibacter echinorum TaxID=1073325 RepID=A0A1M5I788_SALEC|nr:rhodanese-like domain-containing protein [Salegentibacter echinorum]SHG24102.1 Rhodanese-related sulfurtransferase [Salegentibacter echinorum]
MKQFLIYCFILIGVSSHAQADLDKLLARYNSQTVPYISVEELKMQSKDTNLVILDAREPKEFKVSHIKSAVYAGFSQFSVTIISHLINDKSRPVVVYCSLGIRSETISEKLKKEGYSNVSNLYGGIFEWKNKGYSVYNEFDEPTERVHVFAKRWAKYLKNGEKIF